MQPNSPLTEEDLDRRAANIKILLMDVDGVLTDGRLYLIPNGDGKLVETKGFDSQDGIALRWLSWFDIKTGVISGRESPATRSVPRQVGMKWVFQGHIEKIPLFERIVFGGASHGGRDRLRRRRSHGRGHHEACRVVLCHGQCALRSEAVGFGRYAGGGRVGRGSRSCGAASQSARRVGRFAEEIRGIGLTDTTSGKVGLVLTTVSGPGSLASAHWRDPAAQWKYPLGVHH